MRRPLHQKTRLIQPIGKARQSTGSTNSDFISLAMRPTPLHLQMCPNMLSLNCENVKTTPPKQDRNVPKYVVAAGVSRRGPRHTGTDFRQ